VSHRCEILQKAASKFYTLIYPYKLFIQLFKGTNRSEKDSMCAPHYIWKLIVRTFEKADEISSCVQYSADTHNTPIQSTALHNDHQNLVALWVRHCTVLDFLKQTKSYNTVEINPQLKSTLPYCNSRTTDSISTPPNCQHVSCAKSG